MEFENDKENISFKEIISINAVKYASKVGNRILFNPNLFNRSEGVLPKNDNRELPIEIERGFTHIDEYEITVISCGNFNNIFVKTNCCKSLTTKK